MLGTSGLHRHRFYNLPCEARMSLRVREKRSYVFRENGKQCSRGCALFGDGS